MQRDTAEEIMTTAECDRQTDGQTDGHLYHINTSTCLACYATALVKTEIAIHK